ncbi:MAG: hypothetical protein ACLSWV_03305 [Pygmaiobacter massiliensis]
MFNAVEASLKIAAEITVARAGNTNVPFNREGGENVGNFFSAVYKTVLALAEGTEEN